MVGETISGTGAEIIVRYLEEEGVQYLFGVPGGHLLQLYDALYSSKKIKPVLTRHEGGASFMACGYALATGKIGVCCGTVGPGATNLITGVAAAYADSIPLLVLTAQVGTTTMGKGSLQDSTGRGRAISQVGLFSNICKLSMMETRSENIAATLRYALRLAYDGRPGPVHLDIPADVLKGHAQFELWPSKSYRVEQGIVSNSDSIAQAAGYLAQAKRPGILVGWGAVCSKAHNEIRGLAELLGIPVATTLRAKGIIPENHPLSLGCIGLYGTNAANSYFRSNVDVLLTVGCSLHEFTTHAWDEALMPTDALLQIDIDSSEIGKNYPVTVGITGDAKQVLTSLVSTLSGMDIPKHEEWLQSFKASKGYFDEPSMQASTTPIKPQRLMADLNRALPDNTVIVSDIGNCLTWVERYFQTRTPYSMYALTGLAAMGSGVAASIGIKLALLDTPVVCICGDGGFQMTGMEVSTAVNLDCPVVWVILNDSRLGMINDVQRVNYKERYIATNFRNPNFSDMARSFGAEGFQISSPDEIVSTIKKAISIRKPVIVDVIIDPTETPPLKPRMLALKRSFGLPEVHQSLSWQGIKALIGMERG